MNAVSFWYFGILGGLLVLYKLEKIEKLNSKSCDLIRNFISFLPGGRRKMTTCKVVAMVCFPNVPNVLKAQLESATSHVRSAPNWKSKIVLETEVETPSGHRVSAVPKRGRSKRGRTQKHGNARKRTQKSAKGCKREQKSTSA